MMILRYCLCCFGYNQNSPNDSKRLLDKASSSKTNKHYVHAASEVARDAGDGMDDDDGAYSKYEEAITKEKTNWAGSRNSLTESVTNLTTNKINSSGCRNNLAASTTNLTASKSNLTGSYCTLPRSKTNILISASRQFIHSTSKLYNGPEITRDSRKPVTLTPQKSPLVKTYVMRSQEFLKCPSPHHLKPSNSMTTLPAINVVSSSSSRLGSAENTTNSGVHTLFKGEREVKSLSSSPNTSSNWLKSQSMLDVTCASHNGSSKISRSTNDLAQYGLDRSLYENPHNISKSMEAVNRVWRSMDEFIDENGFVDQSNGAVHFVPSYDSNTKKLTIQIEKIEGLAPKGVKRSKYDCIIKLTMVQHEKQVKFSNTIPAHSVGALDLEECIIFHVKDPLDKVLRISVYDTEFRGKYDAVGHALFYVVDALTHEQKPHALKLFRQSMPDIQAGSIKIVLKYNKPTESLNVLVDKAFNLPVLSGKCKSFLKLTQYSFGKKVKEICSPNVSSIQQFRYGFTVDLKIDSSAFQNSFIVISVKMRTFLRDMLVGRVILGPFFYAEYGRTLTPWGRALIKRETVSHIFRLYQ